MYRSRILKEANEALRQKDPNIILTFNETDLYNWVAYLLGPDDSPYGEGIFEMKISLSSDYPLQPPKLYFKTRIFHPNVHWETGEVCVDIIKNEWRPSWTIESLCRAIQCLMSIPNADSPLNCDCGNLVRNKQLVGYKSMAQMYTMEYAIPKKEFLKEVEEFNKKFVQPDQKKQE